MAKTKASVAAKVTSGKSSKARCTTPGISKGSSGSGRISHHRFRLGPGNRVRQRNIPEWQQPISHFFPVINKSSQESNVGIDLDPIPEEQEIVEESSNTETTTENEANNISDEMDNMLIDNNNIDDNNANKSAKGKGTGKKTKQINVGNVMEHMLDGNKRLSLDENMNNNSKELDQNIEQINHTQSNVCEK